MANKNISTIHDCYGCGVCAASCGKKIITIELNSDGFYEPRITEVAKCTHCGICVDVCAFSHTDLANKEAQPVKSWAAWSNDERIRRKCSSGGIGFEIGKQLIEQGYKAVGCRYDVVHQRAEHYIATTVDDFIASIGSKYIQSYTAEAFSKIQKRGEKYLVTGTPCQIDSFRRMIRKFKCEDNFILLDFFCHCVPSMYAWKAYIKMLEPKIGEVTYASWRNKFEYGWHDSWLMGLDGEKVSKPIVGHASFDAQIKERKTTIQSRMSQGDLFYKLFLGDITLGPQCEKQCKYKYSHSSADIRIGDLWGNTYKKDQKGVSALVAFTEKGCTLIEGLKDVSLVEHSFETVTEGQMKENAKAKTMKPVVMYMLRHGISVSGTLFKSLMFIQRILSKIKRTLGL